MMGSASSGEKKDRVCLYVDEAGDPCLFSRRGTILVGTEGVSKYFLLGMMEVSNVSGLCLELEQLREDLLADPYFKNVPSMHPESKKTAIAFHAKDDLPEVRREVFRLLLKFSHQLRFSAVVRDKSKLVQSVLEQNRQDKNYRYNDNEVYDNLVTALFRGWIPRSEPVEICYAKRGKKTRTNAFQHAIEKAGVEDALTSEGNAPAWKVQASSPVHDVGLQAADYFLWALQRFYEKRESRFVELIWSRVHWVYDLDYDGFSQGMRFDCAHPLLGFE